MASPARESAPAADDATKTTDRNPAIEAWSELWKDENAPLRALYTMVSMEVAGFAMCLPVLAFFAIKEIGVSPSQLGFIVSANSTSQLIGSWACGRLSDSLGRKWLLIGAFGWSCLNIGGTAFVYTFWELLLLRTLGGLSGGTTPLCQAYIMDWVDEKARPGLIGIFGFLTGVAFLTGNVMGMILLLNDVERRDIFLIAALFASLATLYGMLTIEESLDPSKQRPLCGGTPDDAAAEEKVTPRGRVSDMEAINTGLVCVWTSRFFVALAGAIILGVYAFVIDKVFGWNDMHMGAVMATFGTVYALEQLLLYPQFGKHGKEGSGLAAGVANVCGIIGGIIFPFPVVWVHLTALFLLTTTGALFDPAVPVLVSIFAGESHLGFGNGVATAFRCAASIIGPFLGGVLFEIGLRVMCWTACIFYVLGVFACIGIVLSPSGTDPERMPILTKKEAP